ncbi:OsmC family protein [Polaromonas sp. YR568]|uniref:OsmC family protein n=1 Tax=Polaromonas sp. YR568 TaxID=1855301 RepID=UPI00313849AC
MSDSPISLALQRAEEAFAQKPGLALQNDAPAKAVFVGGLATQVAGPAGHTVGTDMPVTLGGAGACPGPGWLMRAGLASCTATVIAMRAERLGIRLTRLAVTANSRSDARGLLGVDPLVAAGPLEVNLDIDIAADGQTPESLAELVAWADAHSPVTNALRRAIDVQSQVRYGAITPA